MAELFHMKQDELVEDIKNTKEKAYILYIVKNNRRNQGFSQAEHTVQISSVHTTVGFFLDAEDTEDLESFKILNFTAALAGLERR